MHISDFDYELPAELIAQRPLERRDQSRMLVLNRVEEREIDEASAEAINAAREKGGRVIAIGTTTRALESATDQRGRIKHGARMAHLTITPGYEFRAVDALLTNFHLPRSSLLPLVGAFAGRRLALAAYAHAVRARYRFYSYDDCMLII